MKKFVMGAALAATLFAIAGKGHAAPGAGAYYYDGGRKIGIETDTTLVADFGQKSSSKAVANLIAAAQKVPSGVGGPRVYRVPAGAMKTAVDSGAAVSPVYRQSGRLMALPGGVVVTFNPAWTDAQVRDWANAKGYPVQQRLNITGNWYLLKTAVGMASLDAANAIQESGEVISATPNWWMETVTK